MNRFRRETMATRADRARPPISPVPQDVLLVPTNSAQSRFPEQYDSRTYWRDITVFYAFCRVIDDIADDIDLAAEEKQRRLAQWREWLRREGSNESPIARDIRALIDKYALAPEMFDVTSTTGAAPALTGVGLSGIPPDLSL